MKNLTLGLVLFATVALAGQKQMDMPNMGHMTAMAQHCPMQVKGADIAVADSPTGISLTFTTSNKKDVGEIRRRVQEMAKMHNAMPAGSNEMMNCCASMTSAVFKAVPNGARLTLKPKDPIQLESFRKQIREHLETMKTGECCTGGDSGYCPMHSSSKRED